MRSITFVLLTTVIALLCSCDNCSTKNIDVNYEFVDKLNNVLSVENLQNTYQINDTIWFKISIPDDFIDNSNNVKCEIPDSSISIFAPTVYLFRATDTIYIDKSLLYYKRGILDAPHFVIARLNNSFEGIFGVLINSSDIAGVSLSTFEYVWIENSKNENFEYCYDASSKCPNIRQGFIFQTQIEGLNDSKFYFTVIP